jgi:starvation-inducible DNA-binding protein
MASTTTQTASLRTPTYLGTNAVSDIAGALTTLLADTFALYIKTKNFHWHVSGPHFRDYHLLMDEQASQIFATTDPIAERVRKLGGTTLRSISHLARLQRIADNDAEYVAPRDMLAVARRQHPAGSAHARGTPPLRRARRRRYRQPARDLDRRGRGPRLVLVRGQPTRLIGDCDAVARVIR